MTKVRNHGFSLVEVIVVLAIMGIVTLASTSLIMNFTGQINTVALKLDRIALKNQIVNALKKSDACRINLTANAINVAGTTPIYDLTNIKDYNSSGLLLTTIVPGLGVPVYPGSRLQVATMRFTSPALVGIPTVLNAETGSTTYLSALRITFMPVPGEPILGEIVVPSIVLKTDTSSGAVQSCALEKTIDMNQMCQTVLGLTMVGGVCKPQSPAQQRALCTSMGGVPDPTSGATFTSCSIPTGTGAWTCPIAGDVVVGFNAGVPICQKPTMMGVWSAWSTCTAGTKTRTCLVGTCGPQTSFPCPP